jgi:protein TonB
MKRILSIAAAVAAVFAIASCNGKPSAEEVASEAVKNANALVQAVAAADNDAIHNALVADVNAFNALGIDPAKDTDLVKVYDDNYENTLEDNGIDKDAIIALLKKKGIEIPEAPKPIEAKAETEAETPVEAAADSLAADAAAVVDDAEAAAEKVKETLNDYVEDVEEEEALDETFPEEVPYLVVEQKPSFNGGDANEFSKWVNKNLTYPQEAQDKGIEGRVVLKFKVDKEGNVKDVTVLRGVDPTLDAEAVKVVESSPAWTPGMQGGKAVDVSYTFPVIYKIAK